MCWASAGYHLLRPGLGWWDDCRQILGSRESLIIPFDIWSMEPVERARNPFWMPFLWALKGTVYRDSLSLRISVLSSCVHELRLLLKGVSHEIFSLLFLSQISFPPGPEYPIGDILHFYENSRIYSNFECTVKSVNNTEDKWVKLWGRKFFHILFRS